MKKILFGVLGLFMLLSMSACDGKGDPATGRYITNGSHIVFDFVCDDTHKFGVWIKVYEKDNVEMAAGFSVRMTQEEYNHYCLE